MRSKFVVAALSGLFMAGVACAQSTTDAGTVTPPADPQNILNIDLSTGGRVQVQLRPDKAPHSVERVKTLTRRNFYDGLIFHRVIDGFMAQGGDPRGTGEGGSDLPDMKAEFNDLPHVRGTMSMARAEGLDTANSQFFIMLQPNLNLDGNYTAIGRVISGMQYVDALEKGEPPENPSRVIRMTIESDERGLPPAAFVLPPPAVAQPDNAGLTPKERKKAAKQAREQEEQERKAAAKQAKQAAKEAKAAEEGAEKEARRAAKAARAATPPAAASEPVAEIDPAAVPEASIIAESAAEAVEAVAGDEMIAAPQ